MKKVTKRIRYDLATTFGLVLDTNGDGNDSKISDVPDSSDTEIYDDNSIATGFFSDKDDIVLINAQGWRVWQPNNADLPKYVFKINVGCTLQLTSQIDLNCFKIY